MEQRPSSASPVLLVFPPQCQTALRGPHLGIPQLAGYLQRQGHQPRTRDLNIELFRYLTAPGRMRAHLGRLRERREALHGQARLSEHELAELLHLSSIDSLAARLERYEDHALLGDADFRRCLQLVDPLLEDMPSDFEDILGALDTGPDDIVRAFHDQLDLDRLCAGTRLIGISVAFHLQLYPALDLARRIRARFADEITVVLGGSQISLMTEAQKCRLARLPFVDAVVVHEGEIPLLALCRQVEAGQRVDFSQVPNTYYQDGDTVRLPTWHSPLDMAALPPPRFDEHALGLYLRPLILPVYVSKGCYWGKCKFCDYTKLYTPGQAKTQAWAVFRPVDTLVEDIASLQAHHGATDFYLVSEAITPAYYRALSRAAIARDLGVTFSSYCRVEKSYDLGFFRLLHEAGVRALTFGVEATEDRILRLIDKGNTVEDIRSTIRHARAAGIEVYFNLIPDYPTITWDEVTRTAAFIRENIDFISHLNHQLFDLSANSPIAEEEDAHGIAVDKERCIQTQHGVHSLPYTRKRGLRPEQIQQVRRLFHHLASDILVYRRVRDLLGMSRSEHFDWNRASFVLARDMESFALRFDPSRPVEPTEPDDARCFERRDEPVLILALPAASRWMACAPAVSLVLETARTRGVFSVDEVLRHLRAAWRIEDAEAYRLPVIRCLQSLVQEGFIGEIFHPWLGPPSENLSEILAAGEAGSSIPRGIAQGSGGAQAAGVE